MKVQSDPDHPLITRADPTVYQLATNQSLASGANTSAVDGVPGASYLWDVQGSFAGGSTVSLQYLKSDGATWAIATKPDGTPATVSASGIVGVVLGGNASVRLLGAVATTTNLYSSLS
ncbi:hypothetical protein [Caulobacter sp. BK020]|uniref:hypothetical protein n=1 Tax=Caulobacter sp. BK020 TaxID=2512117 RepID=UPI00104C624B|nr:hypothetical protein [Caulobacter sp. BK020]TCS14554.1 hypothetical protein EV278_107203 [Caulobacter sp. BK020]